VGSRVPFFDAVLLPRLATSYGEATVADFDFDFATRVETKVPRVCSGLPVPGRRRRKFTAAVAQQ
jgi:hypothetical protein